MGEGGYGEEEVVEGREMGVSGEIMGEKGMFERR